MTGAEQQSATSTESDMAGKVPKYTAAGLWVEKLLCPVPLQALK